MKQYSTRFLKTIAIFFMLSPVTYILMAAPLFDIPLKSCINILLSPSYYLVCFFLMATGFGIWELYRWSWYVLMASQVFLLYENALFVFNYSESYHKALALLIATFFQFTLLYKITKDLRVPYLFPKIRWWESNPRYRLSIPVAIRLQNGDKKEGEILDLSYAGCFVKFRGDLKQDEPITLQFNAFGNEMECEGLTVWLAQSTVTHPRGIGVKFNPLSKSQRRVLRLVNRKLKKVATHYRRFRYLLSQEEFTKKLDEIEALEK